MKIYFWRFLYGKNIWETLLYSAHDGRINHDGQHWWNNSDRHKPKIHRGKRCSATFFHHKLHVKCHGIETGPPVQMSSSNIVTTLHSALVLCFLLPQANKRLPPHPLAVHLSTKISSTINYNHFIFVDHSCDLRVLHFFHIVVGTDKKKNG